MKHPGTQRNPRLWVGVGLAALAGLLFALNSTAIPAVVDTPLATLVVATLGTGILVTAVVRESGRAANVPRGRLWVGVVALVGTAVLAFQSVHHRFLSYRSEEVRFRNEDVDLAGTLYTPPSRTPHPAVVFIHGSGPETRKEYAFFARLFARDNFIALAYDKRGTGESSGRLYESAYRDYAQDALAAVRYLTRLDQVDARCIGLIGFSEGEWVAPLAVSLSNNIAFLIVVAPSGVSPARQVNQEIALRLTARGYSPADVARALALNERVFEYQRTGQTPDGLADELRAASKEPWFLDAQDIPGELYPPDTYRWWRSVMDFAPGPVWQRVKIPVLLLKGGKDSNSEAALAQREIEAALRSGGNHSVQFALFPDGDHSLLAWPLGDRIPPPVFADGYLQTMLRWAGEQQCAGR